ncbi:MAG: hypothetical protein LUC88_04525 [Prevotella sp.]|nr:hypothetical protein [Prevotella sp.]
MSNYVVYVKVKPFIGQWLNFHFGDPIAFPSQSVENATIRRFLAKMPAGMQPLSKQDDEVSICIPDSKQKPVITYNYLGERAKACLIDTIEDTFRIQLWKDLNDLHDCGCSILKAIDAWCENNGISIEYDYTIKMRYQRMRRSYLKNGVDLRNKTHNHDDN